MNPPNYTLFLNICKQYNLSFSAANYNLIVTQPFVNPCTTILEYNTFADEIYMASNIILKLDVNNIKYTGAFSFNKSKFIQLLNDYNRFVIIIKQNLIQSKLNSIEKDF